MATDLSIGRDRKGVKYFFSLKRDCFATDLRIATDKNGFGFAADF